ncbi:MAG: metallophosphoesterase family protein [Anaerolineae bacterium]|nr:metallophosphoesterase family protein [Anaerolineae bacterium]
MRIAVITDAHANLPALEAALAAMQAEGCDAILHTGDAIGIGPYPAECLDLLLNTPRLQCLMGNHESYFVDGLPVPRPAWLSEGEVAHQRWTHAHLDPRLRPLLAGWPYALEHSLGGVRTAFMHYGLVPSRRGFQPIIKGATSEELDQLFACEEAVVVFYGHDHRASDMTGRARYVNPGSLGCYHQAIARYCRVTLQRGRYTVEHRRVPYDDAALFAAFEQREVPERAFIYRAFFGGRFAG